ncbi:MAG TPA: hypothetical protein VLV30_03325 [Methanomicrobiales archaeon]|nr:hypothetical protein [Methanomicrobiales archaeon]
MSGSLIEVPGPGLARTAGRSRAGRAGSCAAACLGVLAFVLVIAAVQAAGVNATTQTTDVYVSSVAVDPVDFFPHEEGTISVTLMNSGDEAIALTDPTILSNEVHILTSDMGGSTVTSIPAGTTATYTFLVRVDAPDGTYFPLFTVSTGSASIHYPVTVKVDSTDIGAIVSGKPAAFPPSAEEMVNLTVFNPRGGVVKNILVTASGEGLDVNPSQKYISSLDGQGSADLCFGVTALADSNLTFHISYENGDNAHSSDVFLPVAIGGDKTAAEPVLNNVALTSKGTYYDLTGDITNAGITDAKGLVVTVGSPAAGTEAYPEYAIGSLASDDSGSFELTFTCQDLSSVPLVMRWKDANGNNYDLTKYLDLRSGLGAGSGSAVPSGPESVNRSGTANGYSNRGSGAFAGPGGTRSASTNIFGIGGGRGGGIASFYPVIAGAVILVVAIVTWKKRKWVAAKLKRS